MIYSKIEYGLPVYGMTSQENILKIQTMQSKLLKILTNKPIRYSTNQLHNDLNILKVKDIVNQEILLFVHNFMNNKLPDVFARYYTHRKDIQTIQTRNIENKLVIPMVRTDFGASSLKVVGPKLWNQIPNAMQNFDNIKSLRDSWRKSILPYPIN